MTRNSNERGHGNALSPLELYIHIPFCVRKCAYCDFLSFAQDEETIERYVHALVEEIEGYRELAAAYEVVTVFLGGGTPSILDCKQVERIFQAMRDVFFVSADAEITIEANPGTVTEEKLRTYRNCGINRISFGLQSANNEELKLLGRIHSYEEFLENYRLAREVGFDNINVDLISAIPKQTTGSWEESLRKILALCPEHISAYSLIVEDGTPFAKWYGEGGTKESDLPSEEDERTMYYQTERLLEEAGYHRYEISNYAREGRECRHNLGYWERTEYLGIGLGASSLMNETRFHNVEDLGTYLAHSKDLKDMHCDMTILSEREQMEEFLFLGLRKMQGISFKEFEETFGKTIEECYGVNLIELKGKGLLEEGEDFLRLTKKGIDVSNYVFGELLFRECEK